MSKIVITGLSTISAAGIGYDALKENIATGVTPAMISEFEMQKLTRETAVFNVDFEPKDILGRKGLRTMDKAAKLLLSTIHIGFGEWLEGLSDEEKPGLITGTGFGSIESIGNFTSVSIETGVGSVNPKLFGNTVINSPTGQANIRFGLKNLSATMSTGLNSGLAALVYSADYLKNGYLNNVFCSAVEEASAYTLLAMEKEGCTSKTNEAKPFGKDANGLLLGEGSAVLLMETEEYATARGAEIKAEVAGYAQGFDPNGGDLGFNPEAEVATEVIKMALADAGIEATAIDFVVSDANGTPVGDAVSAKAINAVFGAETPVTSYRATLGEGYGVSGMLDAAAAIADLEENRVSPIPGNYDTIEGLNLVQGEALSKESTYALLTSFTVDGNCSAVVIKKR